MRPPRYFTLLNGFQLLALVVAVTIAGQSRAEATAGRPAGVVYGLDRLLGKAAPGLAQRVRPGAPEKGIDTRAGYPYYAGPRIVADAPAGAPPAPATGNSGNLNVFNSAMPTGQTFVVPSSRPGMNRAVAQAPAAPSPSAAAPMPPAVGVSGMRAPANSAAADVNKWSTASSLQQEIDSLESQMAARQAANAFAPKQAAIAQVPTPSAPAPTPASSRLLAGLKPVERQPASRIDTYRQELAVAEFAAAHPALKNDDTRMYVTAAASGEADAPSQVSRVLRGARPGAEAAVRPAAAAPPEAPYEYQHNKNRDPEEDAPGGVWHVRR